MSLPVRTLTLLDQGPAPLTSSSLNYSQGCHLQYSPTRSWGPQHWILRGHNSVHDTDGGYNDEAKKVMFVVTGESQWEVRFDFKN